MLVLLLLCVKKKNRYVVDWAWLHFTMVCISLVCLTFWTLYIIRNLNMLTHLLDLRDLTCFNWNSQAHLHGFCGAWNLNWGMCIIRFVGWFVHETLAFFFSKKKKKIINLSSHWVTGPLASLSIECSRKNMRNLNLIDCMASLAS